MQALQAMPPTRRDTDGRWADVWAEQLDGLVDDEPWLFQFFDHPTRDEYWEGRDIDASAIEIPTLAVSGWRDGYPATTLEYAEMIDAETLVLLGPWRHVMPHRGREVAIGFRSQVADWFDTFLKGEETGILDGDRIRFWTECGGGGSPDVGTWRGASNWPRSETAETLSFILDGETLRSTDDTDSSFERMYDIDHSVGAFSYDQGKPLDTTPDDVRSLTVETDPFEDAIELTGTGRVRVPVSSTLREPVVAVRLVDVSPDGTGTLVTHAERRVELEDDGDTVTLQLKPKSHVFEPGHRLRLAIAGAFYPAVMPPAEGGSLTVTSTPENPLEVSFPGAIYRSSVSFDGTIEMPDPEPDPPAEPDHLDADREWTITRSAFDDRLTIETDSSHAVEIADARMEYAEHIESTVLPEDPTSVSTSRTTVIVIEYPAETVTVEATSRVGQDGAQATTRVERDEQTAFEHTWNSG
jgi:predicted acyl esterase